MLRASTQRRQPAQRAHEESDPAHSGDGGHAHEIARRHVPRRVGDDPAERETREQQRREQQPIVLVDGPARASEGFHFVVGLKFQGNGLEQFRARVLAREARELRIRLQVFLDERARVHAGLAREVDGQQIEDDVAGDLHGWEEVRSLSALSLSRARWIFTRTAPTESWSARAISSWDRPSWAFIRRAARSVSGRNWSARRAESSSSRSLASVKGPGSESGVSSVI